jgi:glutamate racemase
MQIGIYDSGLGGLVILKTIKKLLPEYDYLYLGDTANLPYGDKTQKEIYELAKKAVAYLFDQDCQQVIIACNTISSEALKKLQQSFLPQKYPERKILGVIIPTLEELGKYPGSKVVLLATTATVRSKKYNLELAKLYPAKTLIALAAPNLASTIEALKPKVTSQLLKRYCEQITKHKPDTLVLGCTHYGLVKAEVKLLLGPSVRILAQEEVIPKKLQLYLKNHLEIRRCLTKNHKVSLLVTKNSPQYKTLAKKWFGALTTLKTIVL